MNDRWWWDAACQGVPVETFYPRRGTARSAAVAVIARYCVPCPVRAQCLADELAQPVTHRWGIRGGVWTPSGRHRQTLVDPYGYLPADDGGAA